MFSVVAMSPDLSLKHPHDGLKSFDVGGDQIAEVLPTHIGSFCRKYGLDKVVVVLLHHVSCYPSTFDAFEVDKHA